MKLSKSFLAFVIFAIFTVAAVVLFVAATPNKVEKKLAQEEFSMVIPTKQKVTLTTKDRQQIAGVFYNVEKPIGYLVFFHMMPATKESWDEFATRAQKAGYASIAIDFRGHGESSQGPRGYMNFSDEEHQKSILDVDAAVEFLKQKGADDSKLYLIGASIGANLALQYLAEHAAVRGAVLLSSGFNYRGIETPPLVQKLQSGQKVLFAAAQDDARAGGNAVEMSQSLYASVPKGAEKKIITYKTGGHGTDLFSTSESPDLADAIIEFIRH